MQKSGLEIRSIINEWMTGFWLDNFITFGKFPKLNNEIRDKISKKLKVYLIGVEETKNYLDRTPNVTCNQH